VSGIDFFIEKHTRMSGIFCTFAILFCTQKEPSLLCNEEESTQKEPSLLCKRALSKKFEKNRELLEDKRKIPNIYKDNFVDLAKLCDSAKKIIH